MTTHVIEVKDSHSPDDKRPGEPQHRYVLQLMSYMHITGADEGHIVITSKWNYATYTLRRDKPDTFILYDDTTDLPYSPAYGDQWNNTTDLSVTALKARIELMQGFMRAVNAWKEHGGAPVLAPIEPFDSMGWLCVAKPKKTAPKTYKTKPENNRNGQLRPNCQFAQYCHGLKNQWYEYTEDKQIIREDF